MVNISGKGLLGVVLFARHGDREEFFQEPHTYTPSDTKLTALGTVQEDILGDFLKNTYITGPSTIPGLDFPVANLSQLIVRGDADGEGSVILSSTAALLSGLFPPTPAYNITLANGTTVVGALGGNQFIPIESVEPNDDISLNSFTSCPNFDEHIAEFYASPKFKAEARRAAPFLSALAPFLDGRSTNFKDMYNIFDYVNVNYIHNATFHEELPATFIEQAYDFANFHENGVFSDVSSIGIGNVAFRTILPSVFSSLLRIAGPHDPLKMALNGISYKPFVSFFNITAASISINGKRRPLSGIVDYASVLAIEMNAGTGYAEPFVTVKFKNGTKDETFHEVTLGLFGEKATSVPLHTFIRTLKPIAIDGTERWCTACDQHVLRGCGACNPVSWYDKGMEKLCDALNRWGQILYVQTE